MMSGRFLDVVPANAGKRKAMEFVMQRYGFTPANTVACGDSGNDKLMLSGVHVNAATCRSVGCEAFLLCLLYALDPDD